MAAARGHFNLTTSSQELQLQRQYYSAWHSPIPYLFGGLAVILGLVAFSLVLLACSHWRLSGHFDERGRNGGGSDVEAGEGKEEEGKTGPVVEEMRVVVIVAGEEKPTFLAKATPMWRGRSSYMGGRRGGLVSEDGGDDQGAREMKRQGRCPGDNALDNV